MALTEKLKTKIKEHSFEFDRMERLANSMEDIFRLVGSRDFSNLRHFQTTKLGNAILDIAEEFAITQTGLIKDFRTFANTGKLPAGDPISEELKTNLNKKNIFAQDPLEAEAESK